MHIGSLYLENYAARRVSWNEVLASGRPLPEVGEECSDAWRTSGKDARLAWKSSTFLCLDGVLGGGYRPQGVGGSATTQRYRIDGQPAASRNLILTSWYSRAREPGLFAPNRDQESVTRLVVMDMDQRRYNSVELVRPDGTNTLRNLNSHGSGLVWAGQYLYSSSRSALWMYNADDIVKIDGHYVLPAIARWSVTGRGGLSSISLDQSATPHRLTGINYTKTGRTYVQSFELAPNGLLADQPQRTDHSLVLTSTFGGTPRVVHSARSLTIPGASYQGVGVAGPYGFANSSALSIGPTRKPVDAMALLKDGEVIRRFRMPQGNVESIYIDYRRGRYVSLTERGHQFMFDLPLRHLTRRPER